MDTKQSKETFEKSIGSWDVYIAGIVKNAIEGGLLHFELYSKVKNLVKGVTPDEIINHANKYLLECNSLIYLDKSFEKEEIRFVPKVHSCKVGKQLNYIQCNECFHTYISMKTFKHHKKMQTCHKIFSHVPQKPLRYIHTIPFENIVYIGPFSILFRTENILWYQVEIEELKSSGEGLPILNALDPSKGRTKQMSTSQMVPQTRQHLSNDGTYEEVHVFTLDREVGGTTPDIFSMSHQQAYTYVKEIKVTLTILFISF